MLIKFLLKSISQDNIRTQSNYINIRENLVLYMVRDIIFKHKLTKCGNIEKYS